MNNWISLKEKTPKLSYDDFSSDPFSYYPVLVCDIETPTSMSVAYITLGKHKTDSSLHELIWTICLPGDEFRIATGDLIQFPFYVFTHWKELPKFPTIV